MILSTRKIFRVMDYAVSFHKKLQGEIKIPERQVAHSSVA
jgi:hypothetical protein